MHSPSGEYKRSINHVFGFMSKTHTFTTVLYALDVLDVNYIKEFIDKAHISF